MYKLARFSVRYPTTIIMVVLAVVLLGYISFQRLGVDLLPELNSPRLFVEIKAGERPPEEMENLFVSLLESAMARAKKVEQVASITRVGRALLTVEYSWDADMDEAFLDLQKTVADFSQNSQADEIIVSQYDPNAVPVLVAILSHPEIDDLDKLRQTAEFNISNELIRLPGIAAVKILGDRKREVEIKADAFTLEAYDLTMDRVAAVVMGSNRNMTGGSVVEMGRRYIIRGVAEFASTDDIKNLIVTYKSPLRPDGTTDVSRRIPVYLGDVASVDFVLSDPENIVRYGGRRCLALEIYSEARYNTIEAAVDARKRLDELAQALPGYQIKVIQDQSRFITAAVTEVEQSGLIGAFLAVLILYFFLRRVGVTAVISLAIPISIVATFNLMYFGGLTLNIMTLGGLALGAGMLVDNAVVVVENTFRHLQSGRSPAEAAVIGAGEVGGAITSVTLTTIVVFLPIVYLHGAAGEIFKDQAWTVTFSLLCSLVVAMGIIPMLCSRFLRPHQFEASKIPVQFKGYDRFLTRMLQKRKIVLASCLGLVLVTGAIVPLVGSEFMPRADQREVFIYLTLPEGTSLERTEGTAKSLEAIISERCAEDIADIYTRVGPAGSVSGERDALSDENSAVIHLSLKSGRADYTDIFVARLDTILADLPDAECELVLEQTALQATLGTTSAPMVVEIKGRDLDILADLTDSVKQRLSTLPELANVETSFQAGRPEINLHIDRTIASQLSLSAEDVGTQLRNYLSGREAGEFYYQGEYTDISVRQPDISLDELENILLETPSGRRVRVGEVARPVHSFAPREILRNNQTRIGRVTAQLTGDMAFDKVTGRVKQALASLALPVEYSLEITGEEKLRQEALGNLKFALLLSIVLVYMVMAAQFESLIHPFVVLLTLPMAAVGTVWVLFLLGIPFNIMSLIGIIMLVGIAVDNAILLVDRINQNRRSGLELEAAIVDAGRTRIRPIIMTSATTVLGLLPLTVGFGEGASLRAPMAVAVIGGLVSSTALTLIVIPSVYYFMAGKVRATEGQRPRTGS